MAELTLQEIFGADAIQDSTTVTLFKSDFPDMTALTSNAGESILVALLNKLVIVLTATARNANPDQSVVVAMAPNPQVTGNFGVPPGNTFMTYSFTAQVFTPHTVAPPDPDSVG